MVLNLLSWWKRSRNRGSKKAARPPKKPSARLAVVQLEERASAAEGLLTLLAAPALVGAAQFSAPLAPVLEEPVTNAETSFASRFTDLTTLPPAWKPETGSGEQAFTEAIPTRNKASSGEGTTQQQSDILPLDQELATLFSINFPLSSGLPETSRAKAALDLPPVAPPTSEGTGDAGSSGNNFSTPVGPSGDSGLGISIHFPQASDQATLEAMAGQAAALSSGRAPQALLSASIPPPLAPPPPPAPSQARLRQRYAQIPLRFEANRGQTDSRVNYMAHGPGYTLFLTNSAEAVLALDRPPLASLTPARPTDRLAGTASAVTRVTQDILRLRFEGANASARVVGRDELAERTNYFKGTDPTRWRTDIANYAQVAYENLYPGIDVVYYGRQQQLEYDLVVKPFANPGLARLSFAGATQVSLDPQGRLVLRTAGGGTVIQHAPVLYQEVNGQRRSVTGRYLLLPGNQVSFQVDAYDASRSLVIDPVVNYSSYFGGSGVDWATAVTVDASGNAYLVGKTHSTDFPTQDGIFTSLSGPSDGFVVKLDPTGNTVLFSTYLGGTSDDLVWDVAVDVSGSVFVSGVTLSSMGFPVTTGAFQATYGGGSSDAFVARLSPAGDQLQYASYLGSSGQDESWGIAVDGDSNAYFTGWTSTPGPSFDAFAAKVAEDGKSLLYYRTLAGSLEDKGASIAVDPLGNAYVVGRTFSSDLPGAGSGWQNQLLGVADGFVARLDAITGNPSAVTYFGGNAHDMIMDVALDPAGNIYLTGFTTSTSLFPLQSPFQATYGGGDYDSFISKFNPTLSALVYSSYFGGNGTDTGEEVVLDSQDSPVLGGYTTSTNLQMINPSQGVYGGSGDGYLAQVNSSGSGLVFSTYVGGSGVEVAYGAASDLEGGLFLAGWTTSTDFPVFPPYSGSLGGAQDAFISKIGKIPASPAVNAVLGDGGAASTDALGTEQTLRLSGQADPNATVTISRDGFGVVGTVMANSTGAWEQAYPSTTLAPGSDATFQVRLDANAACQTPAGAVTINTTDPNRPTVQVPVISSVDTLAAVQYADDGSQQFVPTGPWTTVTGQGLESDYRSINAGTGTNSAAYLFAVTPGIYNVYATWVAGADRATNAPFTIYDGDLPVGSASVNQTQAPSGSSYAGASWHLLTGGFVFIGSNTLKVRLTDNANGKVIADGIRIERVTNPTLPDIEVTEAGKDVALNSGVDYGSTSLTNPLSKTFTVRNSGGSSLVLSSVPTVPAGFTLASTYTAPLGLSSGSSTTFTVELTATAPGFYSGTVSIGNTDLDENPFVFTVQGTVASIDDGEVGFVTMGTWTPGTPGYKTDLLSCPPAGGAAYSEWTYTVVPGRYKVSASWKEGTDRATSAPFTILNGSTPVATPTMNQQQAPNDFGWDGAMWEVLSSAVSITGTTLKVKLNDAAVGNVIADGIKIEYMGPLGSSGPVVQVLENGTDLTNGQKCVYFGSTMVGTPLTRTFTVRNIGDQPLTLNTPINVPVGYSLLTSFADTPLPEGTHAFTATTTTVSGQTSEPSAPLLVRVDRTPPGVILKAPATTTDTSPEVRVTVTDLNDLPNDTSLSDYKVFLDVDLDGDGAFAGNELGRTIVPLHDDHAVFEIKPDLALGNWKVRTRARDSAGNEGCSPIQIIPITSQSAWTLSTQHLTWDPYDGLPIEQTGNVRIVHGLDLDQSPGSSMGLSPALVYNSDTVYVQPLIQATVQTPNDVTLPSSLTFTLTWNLDGTQRVYTKTYDNLGDYRSKGEAVVASIRVNDRITHMSGMEAGRYRWKMELSGTGVPALTEYGFTYVIAQDGSPLGSGWTLSNVDRLYEFQAGTGVPAGILRVYGTGGWRFYQGTPDTHGNYTSPGEDKGTLSFDGPTSKYTYTSTTGERRVWNSNGLQESFVSADGQETVTFTLAASGRVDALTAADGGASSFDYTSMANTVKITAPGGRLTELTVPTSSGRLTQIKDPVNNLRTFGYANTEGMDTTSRITADTYTSSDTLNQYLQSFTYTTGTLSAYQDGGTSDGAATTTTYAPAALQGFSTLAVAPVEASGTDGLAHKTRWNLDVRGRPLQQVAADGGATIFNRNETTSFIESIVDQLSRTTSYVRHAGTGGVTRETLPDGALMSSVIDNKNAQMQTMPGFRTRATIDERGNVQTFDYDSSGRLTSHRDGLGQLTTQVWNSTGLLRQTTDRRGVTTTFHQDSSRRADAMTEGLGPFDAGTSTGGNANNTLKDSTRNWAVNGLFGLAVVITGGKGVGQRRTITMNTASELTVNSNWDPNQTPDATSTYALPVWTGSSNNSSIGNTLQDAGTPNWTVNGWTNAAVFITGGTGAGQRRIILSNTANTLTISGTWTTIPNSTSTYAIAAASATEYRLTTYSYDSRGNLEFVTTGQSPFHPHAVTTKYVYDNLDQQTQVIEAFGEPGLERTTTTNYGIPGSVRLVTDPRTLKTRYVIDSANRVKETKEAEDSLQMRSTRTTFDAASNVLQVRDPLNHRNRIDRRDPLNRAEVTIEAFGSRVAARSVTRYDDLVENVVTSTDPLGRSTKNRLDVRDRTARMPQAVGRAEERDSTSSYDQAGNVIAVTTGLATVNPFIVTTRYAYDQLNRSAATLEAATLLQGGLATGGTATTLIDTTRTFGADQWQNKTVKITNGTGAGQTRTISANTVNVLTVSAEWTVIPDATSSYMIVLDSGTATGATNEPNGTATLTDSSKGWGSWTNRWVVITSGKGAGQYRFISSNSGMQLTLSTPWTVLPDTSSTYEIVYRPNTSTEGNAANTLKDLNQNWTTSWVNKWLVITGGTGAGQVRLISASTANQLTVAKPWGVIPDGTSTYDLVDALRVSTTSFDPDSNVVAVTTGLAPTSSFEVTSRTTFDALNRPTVSATAANVLDSGIVSSATNGPPVTLTDTSKSWSTTPTPQWAGRAVLITAGKGAGQSRKITTHTATQLTLATAWDSDKIPDTTSRYEIVPAERLANVTTYDAAGNVFRTVTGFGGDPQLNHLNTTVHLYDKLNRQTQTITGTQVVGAQSWERVPTAGRSTGDNIGTTLYDTTASWTANFWNGKWVRIVAGTGAGQFRAITGNTATRLDLLSSWTTIPDATSSYEIVHSAGNPSAASGTNTLTDTTKTWGADAWKNLAVVTISGTGTGQRRTITMNTGSVLTVSPDWELPRPDTTSVYLIVPADRLAHATAYDADSNVILTTDPEGRQTVFTYDALNRQRTAVLTANIFASGTATGSGTGGNQLVHTGQTWPAGAWVSRKVRITFGAGLGQERTITANTADTLTVSPAWGTPAPGSGSQYEIVYAERRVMHTDYDLTNQVTAVTDPLGQTTRHGYDAQNRRIRTIDPRNAVTRTGLDLADQVRSTRDPVNNQWTYDVDGLGRTVQETNALGASRFFVYDAANQLKERTDRRGLKREFTYDLLYRTTAEVWKNTNGTTDRTFTFTFDAGNNLLEARDETTTPAQVNSKYTTTPDLQGRPITITNAGTTGSPTVVLSQTYLADGLRSSLSATVGTAPEVTDFKSNYTYDALGRLTQVEQPAQTADGTHNGVAYKRVNLAYNGLSQYTTIGRFKDTGPTALVTSSYGYDPAQRLTSLKHQGATLVPYTFEWDSGDRLTRFGSPDDIGGPPQPSIYSYDRSNQLTNADHSYQGDENYTYDLNGNRIGFTIGPDNRLLGDGTYDYEFDAEGNRTRKSKTGEVWDYEWDHRNRLTKVTVRATVGGTIQKEFKYTYDLFDRRLEKSVDIDVQDANPPEVTRYVYDGEHIVLIFSGATQLKERYLYGAVTDQILVTEQIASGSGPGTVYWPTTDHLGTVHDLLDNVNGSVAKHWTYDAFGQIKTETATQIGFTLTYTGREWDAELMQYDYRARKYDPVLHVFTSEDPIPDDSNQYRYVGNSPLNFVDSYGLQGTSKSPPASGWWSFVAKVLSLGMAKSSLETQPAGRLQPYPKNRAEAGIARYEIGLTPQELDEAYKHLFREYAFIKRMPAGRSNLVITESGLKFSPDPGTNEAWAIVGPRSDEVRLDVTKTIALLDRYYGHLSRAQVNNIRISLNDPELKIPGLQAAMIPGRGGANCLSESQFQKFTGDLETDVKFLPLVYGLLDQRSREGGWRQLDKDFEKLGFVRIGNHLTASSAALANLSRWSALPVQKIAVYGYPVRDPITGQMRTSFYHVARQVEGGLWLNKLGTDQLIIVNFASMINDPADLTIRGNRYGKLIGLYVENKLSLSWWELAVKAVR